jgi:hypothetical protein
MCKIIPIRTYSIEYEEYVIEVKNDLNTMEDMLYGKMINLATKGAWKQWDETMQDGDSFTFEPEMLQNTGDKNINMLWDLYQKTINLKNNLT